MAHKCDGCRYKGEHREPKFQPFGVCNLEPNLWDAEVAYNAEECPHKDRLLRLAKPKTYTLEEIADKICESYDECVEGKCPGFDFCRPLHNGVLEWLRKVMEE